MARTPRSAELLDAQLSRLERDHVLELALDDIADLVCEPDRDPFESRRSPYRAGVDELVLTLSAAERLPNDLTVRLVLPAGTTSSVPDGRAQAALHRRATDLASESWREAMATRSMGHRQLPLGIGIGLGAAVVAYAAAYLASTVDTAAARAGLIVAAAIALTVAWVVGWVVVEAAILDWRLPARRAAACDLLANATVDVTYDSRAIPTRPPRSTPH
jgi:hypothetical protein